MVRSGKGQACDDDIRKCLAWHVHAGPKTGNPKENAMRIIFELLHHSLGRHSSALNKQLPTLFLKVIFQCLRDRAHRLVTREKNKSPGFTFFGKMPDPLGQ